MEKKVTLYSSTTCPHCVTAKEYLNQKGIDFEEKNVQEDTAARKKLMKQGIMAVPVIQVDEEMVVGVDKEKLDNLLSS